MGCGAIPSEQPWYAKPSYRVPGLRSWDKSHLCLHCWHQWSEKPVLRYLARPDGNFLLAVAGTVTGPILVSVLSAMKYHGVRGLAWPLSQVALRGLRVAVKQGGEVDGLVTVPLHPTRLRFRGFNHAELLARLLAKQSGLPLCCSVVRRCRRTSQQAKLPAGSSARLTNVQAAFRANRATSSRANRVGLVDDLITSGATVQAVTAALTAAGWQVPWAVSVGATLPPGPESDLDSSVYQP